MNEYYVYKLIDPRNSKIFYIGKGQKKRMYQHVKDVQCGRTPNNNKKLNNKIKKILKLGLKVKYKKLFITENEQAAFNKEIKIIKEIELKNLCNLTEGGEGNIGRKFTKKHKQKISESKKGITFSKEHKKKISEALKGRVLTEKTKEKISNSKKGNNGLLGKSLSEEHRKNIARSLKGRIPWNKGKNL